MHSFEVNIRICQPENSDVHQGEAWNQTLREGKHDDVASRNVTSGFKLGSDRREK